VGVASTLPLLLALAWLLPLGSFALILFFGPRMGRAGNKAAHVATTAIVASCVLSFAGLILWLAQPSEPAPKAICGDWYELGVFGPLRLTIGYYIDSLTVAMFCMVTLVASCIHFYSIGYMHGELSDVIDSAAPMADGQPVRRRGRYCRFFQCLSLFCFSMLGLVIAGNLAMVFMGWELVGICSYLLIGFWRERQSASNAANKAFIVNRVGDFGMIIGLMIVWTGMGTLSFGDYKVKDTDGTTVIMPGIFSQVKPAEGERRPQVPDGMVKAAVGSRIADILPSPASDKVGSIRDDRAARQVKVVDTLYADEKIRDWRSRGYGYWLLVLAGLGIFCGCVGKSAQFPLHVWLPDAMEGPTPVSALIHAATMVAAGVYLVGRCYPIFTPEVLLIIACVGGITLFMAATIALTATDIKRVLAYSTVSQLGFMMLALGLGGWLAGMMHLFTHAFFKSLLFLCSGSVIHACGTNEMPQMGGLRRKMPITSLTMLIGCLAIAGAGIPTVIGLSGFHSKDQIIAQDLSFWTHNPRLGGFFFYVALIGAGMTAFYMFRLWYMTFAGNPRDGHVYHHAHESPNVMTGPLAILAILAIVGAWNVPWTQIGLGPLLKQSQPAAFEDGVAGGLIWPQVAMPSEHATHADHASCAKAEWAAFTVALVGFVLSTLFYGVRKWNPNDVSRTFSPVYRFLVHKWWFDELYAFLFVRPVLRVSGWVAAIDKKGIDWLADNTARAVEFVARIDDWIDRIFVDGPVNLTARWTYALGLRLRAVQTGSIRQYVVWLAVGVVGLFVFISMF
jgi:NADH-quinone oxidoreductase subunit L